MAITRIQVRGGTAAEWTLANPVLAVREFGVETDSKKIKVGDGAAAWNALAYATVSPADLAAVNAALSSHVGSGATAHALATQSAHGFMSSGDKTKVDATSPVSLLTLDNPSAPPKARDAAGVTVHHNFGAAGHGWTFLGGTTGNLNDTGAQHASGTQCAWFQGNGNNSTVGMRRTGASTVDLTGRYLGLKLRVDDPAQIGTGSTFLIYLGNTTFSNFVTLSIAYTGQYRFFPRRSTYATAFGGSWQDITIAIDTGSPLSPYVSVSGAQTVAQVLANVTDWQIYFKDVNGVTPSRISVQEIFSIPQQTLYPNGVCCLTFDDSWKSHISVAAPILAAAGGRGTEYLIRNSLGQNGYMTERDLSVLGNNYRWAIAHHCYDGVLHAYPGYSAISPAAGIADVQLGRKWLRDNGYDAYNHMAYPQGAYGIDADGVGTANDAADVNFAPYFKTSRLVHNAMPETVPPADPMKLRTWYATSSTTTLSQMQGFADVAKRTKTAMVCVFHDFIDSGTRTSAQWYTSDFQALVTYLNSIGMPMRTIPEVFGGW